MSNTREEFIADISSKYIGGMTMPDVAKSVGLSYSTVRKYLMDAGVEIRTAKHSRAVSNKAPRTRRGVPMREETKALLSAIAKQRSIGSAAGVRIRQNGYIEFTCGENAGRSAHVVLMEARIGRSLLPDECVHHIDGDPQNNDIDNLALMTRAAHSRLHRREDSLCGKYRDRNQDGTFKKGEENV